jgi:DNA/RNA-binding domain of Phe-tRNA-synthetase-like protein
MPKIEFESHPLLDLRVFVAILPNRLAEMTSSQDLLQLLSVDAAAPLKSNDHVRAMVRDMLRLRGFKPTGRSKPASEYLIKAASEGRLGSVNVAVDACNAVSLHSGLPISVVDLDRLQPPLSVVTATAGSSYVFNSAGQVIDISGLLCLHDVAGPCANAVKDSQRTKTGSETRTTLSLIWGVKSLSDLTTSAEEWYHAILDNHGAAIEA